MSAEQIQIYVNLENWALLNKDASNSLNFETYYDHLLRAIEIPMIQFLEQIHNEASIRSQNDPSATPREFQTLLRDFVREPSQQRQQVFLEHLQSGKQSIEHLGTMALLAVRTLTQSLTAGDFELVALVHSQNDAARFYVQTGMTNTRLFLDAIMEAARHVDRNPMCFSRHVKSKEYLANRELVRTQISAALRASINDVAIKAYSSLRQHIAERTVKIAQSNNAFADEQQQQQRSNVVKAFAVPTARETTPTAAVTATVGPGTTMVGGAVEAPTTTKLQSSKSSQSVTPPPPLMLMRQQQPKSNTTNTENARKVTVADFDQRASPMSLNEAKQTQKDIVQSMINVSNKANQMKSVSDKKSSIIGTSRVQLEASVSIPRAHSLDHLKNKSDYDTNQQQQQQQQQQDQQDEDEKTEPAALLESIDLLTKEE